MIENRLPESFAARSKSRMPKRSPSSQCGSGSKSKARGSPTVRTTTFARSSLPSGTESSSKFGACSSRLAKRRFRILYCERARQAFGSLDTSGKIVQSGFDLARGRRFVGGFSDLRGEPVLLGARRLHAGERRAVLGIQAQNGIHERRILSAALRRAPDAIGIAANDA